MITDSKIPWTGPTWNPWQGCIKKTIQIGGETRLREECRHCYMYRDKRRYGQRPERVVRSKQPTFEKPLKIQREVEAGQRPAFQQRLVFTCSWSDWFNPEADDWRPEAWAVIRRCPDLVFQILTKLPERIGQHLPPFWDEIKSRVWLGYSCGMPGAEYGIKALIQHDSAIRFLSCEPLLGRVDVGWALQETCGSICYEYVNYGFCPCSEYEQKGTPLPWSRVDWLILGGESGPKARPMDLAWARSLIAQGQAAGVPVFVKQLGTVWARAAGAQDAKGEDPAEWPADLRVRELPGVTSDA